MKEKREEQGDREIGIKAMREDSGNGTKRVTVRKANKYIGIGDGG